MSYFEFPHTRTYDGDLGYIIKALDELTKRYNNFFDYNSIKFHDPIVWNIETVYTAFEIVYDENTQALYISKNAVPAGIDILNNDYWLLVSPFKIDTFLSLTSINPVANKTITEVIESLNSEIVNINANVSRHTGEIHTLQTGLATETTNRTIADTLINARIDNIIELEPGSTTGDAELQDIRVGGNGVTYQTAGDAVRGQFDEVNTKADNLEDVLEYEEYWEYGINRCNPAAAVFGYTMSSNGTISPSTEDKCVTDYCDLSGLDEVYVAYGTSGAIQKPYSVYYALYDEDKVQIASGNAGTGAINTSAARYLRLGTIDTRINGIMVFKSSLPLTHYVAYVAPVYRKVSHRLDRLENELITETVVSVADFNNLRDCLETIEPTEKNRYIVELPDGVYDIKSYYSSAEILDAAFRGLFVPDYCTLRGVGSRENTILKWYNDNDDISDLISTLNIRNVAGLENITIEASNIRYCVHDDYATSYNGTNIRTVKNCIIKKVSNGNFACGYGAGMRGNAQWLFENCIFIGNGATFRGLSIHNNRNVSKDSNITVKNCRFKLADISSQAMRFESMTDNVTAFFYIYMIGNKFNNASKIVLAESNPELYGQGLKSKVSGYANGFDSSDFTIIVSDGHDYSSYIDLV